MGAEASALGSKVQPVPVVLHVYDVGEQFEVQALNSVLGAMGTGAFHCGVEIYGQEFSFNWKSHGTGVFRCNPGKCPGHTYRTSVHMGNSLATFPQVEAILRRLKQAWLGSTYHILERNCCSFCDLLCQELGVGPIPFWTRNLAGAGRAVSAAYNAVAGVPLTVGAAVSAVGDGLLSFGTDFGCFPKEGEAKEMAAERYHIAY